MGVGVGTASTTAKRSFDGGAPRMSQLKVLVDHAVRRHCVGLSVGCAASDPNEGPAHARALAPIGLGS